MLTPAFYPYFLKDIIKKNKTMNKLKLANDTGEGILFRDKKEQEYE
jgi:hypothetical protein